MSDELQARDRAGRGTSAIRSARTPRAKSAQAVDAAIAALDSGEARIAEKHRGEWIVHQWLKKAVLLSFRLNPMEAISGGPGGAHWWDKVPSKFAGWGEKEFAAAGFPRSAGRDRPPRRLSSRRARC